MWSVLLSVAVLLGGIQASSAGRALTELTPSERLALANELLGYLDNHACTDQLKITLGQVCMVMTWEMEVLATEDTLADRLVGSLTGHGFTPEQVVEHLSLEEASEDLEKLLSSSILEPNARLPHFRAIGMIVEELSGLLEDDGPLTDDTLRAAVGTLIMSGAANHCEDLLTIADSKAVVQNFMTSLDKPNIDRIVQAILARLTPSESSESSESSSEGLSAAGLPPLAPIVREVVTAAVNHLWNIVSIGNVLTLPTVPEARPAVEAMLGRLAAFEVVKLDVKRQIGGGMGGRKGRLGGRKGGMGGMTSSEMGVEPGSIGSSEMGGGSSEMGPPAVGPPAVDAPAVGPPAVDAPAVGPPAVDAPAVGPAAVDPPAVDETRDLADPLEDPSASAPCRTQKIAAINIVALSVLSGVDQVLLRGMLIGAIDRPKAAEVLNIASELEPEAGSIRHLLKISGLSGSGLDELVTIFHQELPKKRLAYFFEDQLFKNLGIIRGLIDSDQSLCNIDPAAVTSDLLALLEAAKAKYTYSTQADLEIKLGTFFTGSRAKQIAGKLRNTFSGYRADHAKVLEQLITKLRAGGSLKDIVLQVLADVSGLLGGPLDRVVETRSLVKHPRNSAMKGNDGKLLEKRVWGWVASAAIPVVVEHAPAIVDTATNVANDAGQAISNAASDTVKYFSSWGRRRNLNRREIVATQESFKKARKPTPKKDANGKLLEKRGWGWFAAAAPTVVAAAIPVVVDNAPAIVDTATNVANDAGKVVSNAASDTVKYFSSWGRRRNLNRREIVQTRGWFKKARNSIKKAAEKVVSEVVSGTTNLANSVANALNGRSLNNRGIAETRGWSKKAKNSINKGANKAVDNTRR